MDDKYSLADISSCADWLRDGERGHPQDELCRWFGGALPPAHSTWHYIQIPVPVEADTLDAFCPHGNCVTAKIASFAETLRTSNDLAAKRQALLFLVHLVGDIHQPLHAVNRACDNGANSVRVTFLLGGGKQPGMSLHHVWDVEELQLLMADSNVTDDRVIADILTAAISQADAGMWIPATPEQMAWESYRIAIGTAYPAVPYQNFCGGRKASSAATDLSLSYEQDATKIVRKQLMKAGVRLAAILESALGER
jgi:hypothetical protein